MILFDSNQKTWINTGLKTIIPFSAGYRNCNFAMNEMRVVIGTIVSSFSF